MAEIKHFKASELTGEALKDKGLVLVDFWATWCGPCRRMGEILPSVADALDGTATVGKLDVDEEADAAMAYRVSSIPTLIVFKNGEVVERLVGLQSKEKLVEVVNKHK